MFTRIRVSQALRFVGVGTLALAAPVGAPQADAQTIRLAICEYSSKTGPHFREVARAFEKENPGIKVEVEVVPWSVLKQKLVTDLTARSNADLSCIGTRWMLDFVSDDALEPLDGYLDSSFRSSFFPNFLKVGSLNNTIYGLPLAASARALFYNKDLFAKAGIANPPTTWEELQEAAIKIGAGKDVFGFGIQGKETETDVYYYYALWSWGGDILMPDGSSGLSSKEAIEVAEFYKGLIDAGATQNGVTNYTRTNLHQLFIQGRLGMLITIPPLAKEIAKDAPNLRYGVVQVPSAKRSATYGVTDSMVLFSNSRNKEAAVRFLKFAFQTEWRSQFTSNEGFLPVNPQVAAMPEFAEDSDLKAFGAMLPFAHFAPVIDGWEEVAEATINALQRVYLGRESATVAMPQAAKTINRILGKESTRR